MFGRIADRYDLLNRLLSVGQDLRWRRRVRRRVAELRPERTLDVCTGTGDLVLGLAGDGRVYGADFCLPMLNRARTKAMDRRAELQLFGADALRLPVGEGTIDVVTVAFGVRNFEDLDGGLRELARVLRPGGHLLVLEFSQPGGPLAPILRAWVRWVPPLVGRLVSGDPEAYGYLTISVGSFPDGEEMIGVLRRAGLESVRATALTGGVATLYDGVRAGAP
jgi:demethylmenaquinone methyltransferase/2-methoxy-6-polyprenyl-1,4-benzoquinol methylase